MYRLTTGSFLLSAWIQQSPEPEAEKRSLLRPGSKSGLGISAVVSGPFHTHGGC